MLSKDLVIIEKDSTWWQETAKLIDCGIMGFTERRHALFSTPDNGSMEVSGTIAINIRKLAKLNE